VAAHGSPEAKALAFQNLAKVCRIGTHLFHFAEYVNALRGWGRGLRNAVGRSPKTHLITNARSSLQGGAVLVWLMGDTRQIREGAKLYFRKSSKEDDDGDNEDWKDEKSEDSEADLEEVDCAQVLQYIDHFLPVRELAGRPVGLEVLRQFGLVDSERTDSFLNSAFASRDGSAQPPGPTLGESKESQMPKTPQSEQSNPKL
jgi:hypothetical protein